MKILGNVAKRITYLHLVLEQEAIKMQMESSPHQISYQIVCNPFSPLYSDRISVIGTVQTIYFAHLWQEVLPLSMHGVDDQYGTSIRWLWAIQ